jgi:hypothetical protein
VTRFALLFAVAVAALGCTAAADEVDDDPVAMDDGLKQSLKKKDPDTDLDAFEKRSQWIDTYGSMPMACIDKHDDKDGQRALFHGCYDWHSSVHGHWAVYRMDLAGTGEHPAYAENVDARFTEDAVARVAEDLAGDPAFENPYGRAWLLRLVTEHEIWNAKKNAPSTRLRALGDRIAQGLADGLVAPDPKRADYKSDAWTIAQVLSYGRATKNAALEMAMKKHVQDAFEARPLGWADTNDSDPGSFFSTYWSSAYVIALANDANTTLELLKPESLPDEALTPLPDPGVATDVHHLGINWSRAWAIKALARHSSNALGATHPTTKRLVAAYHAHVHAGRERHFRYRGNYYAYDHWVPQFAVYAITD